MTRTFEPHPPLLPGQEAAIGRAMRKLVAQERSGKSSHRPTPATTVKPQRQRARNVRTTILRILNTQPMTAKRLAEIRNKASAKHQQHQLKGMEADGLVRQVGASWRVTPAGRALVVQP